GDGVSPAELACEAGCSRRRTRGASIRVDIARQLLDRGRRARLGEGDGVGDLALHIRADRLDLAHRNEAELRELTLESEDRVARQPGVDLFLGAVAVAVRAGMAANAVGLAFDQRGSVASPGALHRVESRLRHRGEIIAVDDDA